MSGRRKNCSQGDGFQNATHAFLIVLLTKSPCARFPPPPLLLLLLIPCSCHISCVFLSFSTTDTPSASLGLTSLLHSVRLVSPSPFASVSPLPDALPLSPPAHCACPHYPLTESIGNGNAIKVESRERGGTFQILVERNLPKKEFGRKVGYANKENFNGGNRPRNRRLGYSR